MLQAIAKKYDDKERKPQKHTQRWQTSMHAYGTVVSINHSGY